ncbi:hypothetical protein DXG01_016274 [Tephrocybe rancida]|nr:hypothetical protein DXG01_016274 [Tephrocybe rancida]
MPLMFICVKHTPAWRKAVACSPTRAIALLHEAGIPYGDLHLGNIGLAFPGLAEQDPDPVMQHFGAYDITVVLSFSAAKQTRHIPAYLAPCKLAQ